MDTMKICQILEIMAIETEKPELDDEIEELNKYRKLPFPLDEAERNFYHPFRSVSLAFLEDAYQKYLSNLETHDRDDSMNSQEDFDEYNQSENNDSLETYNEEEEELKLSKKTSDVMNEELPALKKEKSNKSNKNKTKILGELQMIDEDDIGNGDKIKFFLLNPRSSPKQSSAPKSLSSRRSRASRMSKASVKKISEEFDDLDLPELSLK